MNVSENLNSINKYKFNMRILIGTIAILLIITTMYMVFADSDVVPVITKIDGRPYMYFKLEHSLSNAQYKYYGYGYHVTVCEPDGTVLASKYLPNSEFSPYMDGSTEKVLILMEKIFDKVDVDDEFYSVKDMRVYLSGRLGIKVNNTLTHLYDSYEGYPATGLDSLETGYATEDWRTVPLNKDGQGIRNGIEHEYGVSWSAITRENLRQHFGIPLIVGPILQYDRYRVEYRDASTKKTVSSEIPYQNFENPATKTEYPVMVNGYEYSGYYKIDKIDMENNYADAPFGSTVEGNSATINIKKNADRYVIVFYYDKVDLSTMGNPVTVNVEYKEHEFNGKKLLNSTTTIGGELSQFNLNSAKIDGYTCKGYYVMGQTTEYFYNTNASFVIGKENYSKPVEGKLKIIFIYEEDEIIETPKCTPSVYGDAETVNIIMKKKEFESAIDISVNNAIFKIDSFTSGKDLNGNKVEGTHEFNYFDLYIGNYKFSYDNKSKEIMQSFVVPKTIFTQSPTDPNLYTTSIDVTYAAFCTCYDGKPDADGNYGWEMDKGNIRVNITLIENKPPVANFTYYTEKMLQDGSIDEIDKAFIGHETIINNQASDPNGLLDIDHIKYILKDSKGNEYFAKLLLLQDGSYMLDEDDIQADNIEMCGALDNGSIKVKFKENENWIVSQYVEDLEGLNDTYTTNLKVEELNLKPIAVLKDSIEYRYPLGVEFNGKQNRVVSFNSNSSYVAEFLEGTGVEINHNRDTLEIVPLDGQTLDGIKFENDFNVQIIDNVIQVKYIPLNNTKMLFKEAGRYNIRLQVTDTNGNVSDFSNNIITIKEDLPPTITANLNLKYYRNTSKNATIKFNALAKSNDDDLVLIKDIGYKFDSNNNGSFEDETIKTTNLINRDVNIGGVIYKEITLTSSNVGKYQFIINVEEDFKQETIEKYITSSDYRTANTTVTTEIDNVAPVGTLGLQKNNNIDVKILTTGLTGTRQTDVENNLNNLKISLESQNNIKVGNIEVLKLANEKNGLLSENSLTWRKAIVNGYAEDYNFSYIDIDGVTDTGGNSGTNPETPLPGFWYTVLPTGVYADGWNGLPVPNLYLGDNLSGVNINNLKYKDIGTRWHEDVPIIQRDFYSLTYAPNRAFIGIDGYSIWDAPLSDVTFFSALTNERLTDFDIGFGLSISPLNYGEDSMGDAVFLFNVQDKNNYFAYSKKYEDNYVVGSPNSEIVQVKNGVTKVLKQFYYTREKEGDGWEYNSTIISRFRQVGNLLQAYSGDTLVFEININDADKGGHLGISAKDGYTSKNVNLNILSLTYIDNSSMYEAINKLNWGNETDKYIINLVENNKLNELTNDAQLNKTAVLLQEEEINLINIGVNPVNGTKLKEINTKNQNNGTYIELENVYDNLNTAASYIKNKYIGATNVGQYLLLGSKVKYIESYSDSEEDPIFSKAFRYYHLPNYFENSLGTIANNNVWTDSYIETFSKVGKYTLNYRVQDNPLFPDLDIYNPFNDYRKYSNISSQDIYIHRKPIASFKIDSSFENNLLRQYSQSYSNISLRLTTPAKPAPYDIVYDPYDYDLYNNYVWFFKYLGLSSRIAYKNYYLNLPDNWTYDGTITEPVCDPNDRDFYTAKSTQLRNSLNIRSYTAYKTYYQNLLNDYYSNIDYTGPLSASSSISVSIPTNAINATLHYKTYETDGDSPDAKILANGATIADVSANENRVIGIAAGTQTLEFRSNGGYREEDDDINMTELYTRYYIEDTNIDIPIIENSYDTDHISLTNKGITEWQWRVVYKDGTSTSYNITDKASGINWVSTQLKNQKWYDATIMLRVKDLEGAYSDWTSSYLSKDNLLDPESDNSNISVNPPIADFTLEHDELIYNSQNQVIYDMSSDPQGLAITHSWKVYKEDVLILSSVEENINNYLNEKISSYGTGKYRIKLVVINSKGLQSEEVTKSFNVIVFNYQPNVNFNLVSNQNPTWTFPKILGLYTLNYRPSNTLFSEEYSRFDTYINDPSTDNTGFIYNWKLERFAVKDISNISGAATNTYSYTTQFPFTNSFKNQGLGWGAYKVTLKVTDKPPIPPFVSTDAKSAEITKYYYIVPETSIVGSFESSKTEVMVGDTITLKATTSKLVGSVNCSFAGTIYNLNKSSEDGNFIYWEKEIVIPESITESGTYNISFIGKTTYGGNGNVTREVKDNVPIDIIALKLINFRITNIVNHTDITFPYTKDMLISNLIPYKTGYNVTFQIDSKGKPDNVYGRIDVGNNGTIEQNINLTRVVTGDTETWQGRFYTTALLQSNTVISIRLDCNKGTTAYNYNEKENWDGRSLVIKGSALQDGRINLTN